MNYSIYAESTPNPVVMKFVSNITLNVENIEILSAEDASQIPLATSLFHFPFVKSLFISGNFIAVTKNETVQWEDIAMQLRIFISDFLNSEGFQITKKKNAKKELEESKEEIGIFSELEEKISAILEEFIQPAVESDGGFIALRSVKDGVVSVLLKGACSGCPSSTVTLKQGIEALLKQKFPNQIKEVKAYEE